MRRKKLQEKEQIHAEISKSLGETEALSTRAMRKLSEKQRLIQEQAHLIKEKEKESKLILEAVENLKEKQRAHEEITKWLEEAKTVMNKLSEKEKTSGKRADSCRNIKKSWGN